MTLKVILFNGFMNPTFHHTVTSEHITLI